MAGIYKAAKEHRVQIQVVHNTGYDDAPELSSAQEV